ncbi:STAS-like domain-containing protein [Chryseobacterium gossypii]|uniref:STAS-like domain-containing protein n=1 Tax=Chryseobacterium gossypii TaxID=3231602 RepID=UPI0035269AE0
MNRNSTCYLIKKTKSITFTEKINLFSILDFISAIRYSIKLEYKELTIDFRKVKKVFPNGMLPIICTIDKLRDSGIKFYIKLPINDEVRRMFRSVNWAFYLAPEQYDKSESIYDRHLVTRRFENAQEQKSVVDDFMDVVLRNLQVPKDILSGLEWSINEITDNVLNHSNSKFGGYIQASTQTKERKVVFAVADSGRGILASMKEGYPDLRTDLDAIGEAIKFGVTRNPEFGQGNGLAGTLRVTTQTKGSIEILSGYGRLKVTDIETTRRKNRFIYNGTMVSGEINLVDDFSISKALDFDGTGKEYIPSNIIDYKYEDPNKDILRLIMKEETTGFGSRKSGLQIRTKLKNLMDAKKGLPLIINWEGVPVISSSFADEMIGKLFLEMGAMSFSSIIRNINMEPLITNLLDKAVSQRLTQAIDE